MINLKRSDVGKRFIANIEEVRVQGKVQFENGEFFLCQSKRCGKDCLDKLGYRYSYSVEDGTIDRLLSNNVTDFKFYPRTAQEIENYKDFQIGDELVPKKNGFSYDREVIAIIGDEIVITKDKDGSDYLKMNTKDKLHNQGWRLKCTPEEESIVELSIAEVATKLGIDTKTLKIVDK